MSEDDIRWMTYAEVQDALGLPSTKAALQRSRRGNWPRRLNNADKLVRVGVPAAALALRRNPSREASRTVPARGQDELGWVTGGIPPAVPDADQMARAEAAEARAAEALALARQVVSQLAEAEARAADFAQRVGRAEGERDSARAERQRLEVELQEVWDLVEQREAELRERVGRAEAERNAAKAEASKVREAEAARDSARAELADWTTGGPLGRAWRALIYRRGRP